MISTDNDSGLSGFALQQTVIFLDKVVSLFKAPFPPVRNEGGAVRDLFGPPL